LQIVRRIGVLIAFVVIAPACGGESERGTPPCVVGTGEMSSILERDDVIAAPQKNRLDCIYASEGKALIRLSVRTREQFEAARDRFENSGFKLPPLQPVQGFDTEANVDPRYNSINVTSGTRIVSVEVVGPQPSDAGDQLDLEKRIARAALDAIAS
jgi:hypothetical protein